MSAKYTDHNGRQIIVVTGMGTLTSLGRGKKDNWDAITAGQSGIKKITRFPTEGLNTQIAGTVDYMGTEEVSAPAISYAMAAATAEEALAEAGFGRDGFPGPLYFAAPPVEVEWQHRFSLMDENPDAETGYSQLLEAARKKSHMHMHMLVQIEIGRAHV